MISYQRIHHLKTLYRLKLLGSSYCDPVEFSTQDTKQAQSSVLPNRLDALEELISDCQLCDLNKTRTHALPGYGSMNAEIMFIASAPTLAEDTEGPYAAKAGSMLKNMIEKVLHRSIEEVYYTHIVKCLPPSFQEPNESEILSCKPFLHKQIELVAPKLIVALGELSYNYLTQDHSSFEKIRGNILPFHGFKLIATHAPSKMITNSSLKREAMQDLQVIKSFLC